MNTKTASVNLENITKIFKDKQSQSEVHAVQEANILIEPGTLVTLLGPSGCGKTTTLRMIAGFELPTRGKVFIGNEDVTYLPPNKRDTAMVFQSYGLFPHMNVFNNVAYGLKLRKIPKAAGAKGTFQVVGGTAAEGIPCPVAHRPACRFVVGRTVVQSGCPFKRTDACRDQENTTIVWDHCRLCDS